MRKAICIFLTMLLVLSLSVTAFAAEFEIDQHSTMDGMNRSWYQGYGPTIKNHTMTLCLPIQANSLSVLKNDSMTELSYALLALEKD